MSVFKYTPGVDSPFFAPLFYLIIRLIMTHFKKRYINEKVAGSLAGIIAIGRLAVGGLAIGHASAGLISIGQLAVGLIFGLGQASTGLYAIGQLALAYTFGIGQFATGYTAIGQFAFGKYVLAQIGIGEHVWDMRGTAPEAKEFFRALTHKLF